MIIIASIPVFALNLNQRPRFAVYSPNAPGQPCLTLPPAEVGDAFRRANEYAGRQGALGAFPTFHQKDGLLTIVLLSPNQVEFRDVPKTELANVSRDDIGELFRQANNYAVDKAATREDFVGAIPTFHELNGRLGLLLLKTGVAESIQATLHPPQPVLSSPKTD